MENHHLCLNDDDVDDDVGIVDDVVDDDNDAVRTIALPL